MTKWFLEFFLESRTRSLSKANPNAANTVMTWEFGLVAEVIERGWIVWVLKRMREAVEEKVRARFLVLITFASLCISSVTDANTIYLQPKQWTELQAGIECLTQLLLLIDAMSASASQDEVEADAALTLRQQLIYNGEVLDIALDSMRTYKEGTQSLAYLDSSVCLAWALFRMLEKWGKGGAGGGGEEMYVRKRKVKKRRGKKTGEEDGVPDVEVVEEEVEEVVLETMFTFEAFEMVSWLPSLHFGFS